MKNLRAWASLPLVAGLTLFPAAPTDALTSKDAFEFHIADALLEAAVDSPPYALATASNGDVIAVDGAGELDAGSKTASGSGRFIHTFANGHVETGTWVATDLVSFKFYGCGGEGLPDDFCGGLAKVNIIGTPDSAPDVLLPATLWIDCLLGDSIPPSASEGIRLNVPDFINFNKTEEHSGFTLFVQQ